MGVSCMAMGALRIGYAFVYGRTGHYHDYCMTVHRDHAWGEATLPGAAEASGV